MAEVPLKMLNVGKVYSNVEKVEVLRNITFEVKRGETVSILGPSGSGKTTLLNLIAGLEEVTKGKVILKGTELTTLTPQKIAHLRNREIGFIFQLYYLIPHFTVFENIAFPLLVTEKRFGKKEIAARVSTIMNELGINHRRNRRPAFLSAGEKQRVAIARALINDPSLILADEPVGNLHWRLAKSILNLIYELVHKEKCSLVLVTHNESIAVEADRCFCLKHGTIQPYT